MDLEPHQPHRQKLPINSHREDTIMEWEFIKLSPRQAVTIFLGLGAWVLLSSITTAILPVATLFGFLLWSWLIIGALFVALKTKDGRPYEEHLTDWLLFKMRDRHYVLKDERAKYGTVEDADWSEIDDSDDAFSF